MNQDQGERDYFDTQQVNVGGVTNVSDNFFLVGISLPTTFTISVCKRFALLDTDNDGLLSYAEMLKEFQSLRVLETHFGIDVEPDPDEVARIYETLFVQFDHDLNGTVDLEEVKEETKQMMLAMADGMGFLPIQMVRSWKKTVSSKMLLKENPTQKLLPNFYSDLLCLKRLQVL